MRWALAAAGAVTTALAAGAAYQCLGAARDRRRHPPPGRFIDVGGRRLHLDSTGSDRTASVVFESGVAASSLSWSLVCPAVGAFAHACSYDRAGLAWSDPGLRRPSLDDLVDDLRLLLSRADVAPPYVLVGHSFGAFVIRAFARRHPDDVAGLVFVDPLHPEEWRDVSPADRHRLRGAVFLSRVGALLAHAGVVRLSLSLLSGGRPGPPRRFSRLFGSQAAALLRRMVGQVQKLPPEVLPAIQAHWSHPRAFQGMARQLALVPRAARELDGDDGAFGDRPVVVLSARDRAARWLAADRALARRSTRGTHTVSAAGGHWLQLDDPRLVVEAVRAVVRAVEGPRDGT